MMKNYYISSSFCPHYKCGTWGYIETELNEVRTGQLEQGYTAYYCEVTALIQVLARVVEEGADDVAIFSRNQSLCARFHREWENMWQINYARKPPWDQVPQLLREIDTKPKVSWNMPAFCLHTDYIRGEVVDQLSLCRDALVERISDELNSVN